MNIRLALDLIRWVDATHPTSLRAVPGMSKTNTYAVLRSLDELGVTFAKDDDRRYRVSAWGVLDRKQVRAGS